MNFDNQVAGMTPGQALMDVPIPKLIENTAKAISAAQYELDSTSVRAATLLSETKVTFNDADGTSRDRSLLELGFIPQFYHFSETEMEFKVTISVRVESGIDFGVEAELGTSESSSLPVAFAGTISFELHHKYEFDMEAVSRIKTKMRSIPPPQAFLEALRQHANSGGGSIDTPEPAADDVVVSPPADGPAPVTDNPDADGPDTDEPAPPADSD